MNESGPDIVPLQSMVITLLYKNVMANPGSLK